MKSMELLEPHTKLYSIENMGEHPEMVIVKKEHTVKPFFTVSETIELMNRYSYLTYIAVQAGRAADRCDRDKKDRGMVKEDTTWIEIPLADFIKCDSKEKVIAYWEKEKHSIDKKLRSIATELLEDLQYEGSKP